MTIDQRFEILDEPATEECRDIGLDALKSFNIDVSPTQFIVDDIIVGTPFNLQQTIGVFGKDVIPDVIGIYHLFYYDQLIYVGMSKSIRGRLLCHLKDNDMPFNYVLWFPMKGCTVSEVLEKEYTMIKRFKPVLNVTHANCR